MLTASEVSAALGIASLPGRPFLGSKTVCYFAADTGFAGTGPSVTLMVMSAGAFTTGKAFGGPQGVHPVTGVGDDAYYLGSGSYVKLGVLKGTNAFSVTVRAGQDRKTTPAQLEQIEESLARKVVARL